MARNNSPVGHDLVGKEQFDHHLAIGCLVEGIDEGLGHILAERRAGIGLHAPADRLLRLIAGGAASAVPAAAPAATPALVRN
jgi:hypothetical protein